MQLGVGDQRDRVSPVRVLRLDDAKISDLELGKFHSVCTAEILLHTFIPDRLDGIITGGIPSLCIWSRCSRSMWTQGCKLLYSSSRKHRVHWTGCYKGMMHVVYVLVGSN